MLHYGNGVVVESKVLSFPTLITKLLDVNKITSGDDEVVVLLKRHYPVKSLRNMAKHFMCSQLTKGNELIKQVRQ